MELYHDSVLPSNTWVRALYDYESDDRTSLSFSQNDVIQVLTQLDSGWWDGIIRGERGWFPSNYTQSVSEAESRQLDHLLNEGQLRFQEEGGYEKLQQYVEARQDHAEARPRSNGFQYGEGNTDDGFFWIPQMTEDGTLFYHNTLTKETRLTLPLDPPRLQPGAGSTDDSTNAVRRPSRDSRSSGRANQGQEDIDESSSSETEALSRSQSFAQRSSYISDGRSPATSLESLQIDPSPTSPVKGKGHKPSKSTASSLKSKRPASRVEPAGSVTERMSRVSARFLDYGNALPLTWDRLLKDTETSIERYKRVLSERDRAQYVACAEDISDHVRLILAAGSGTTDNHSGHDSIIVKNAALYPRFRDMMSKFAKLVLDSHIASSDYPPQDYRSKCFQDADGVMEGATGFIEVARHQRGEEIPRLFPGFVGDNFAGGIWKNNGLVEGNSLTKFSERDGDGDDFASLTQPSTRLDADIVGQMDALRREILLGLKTLDEKLVVRDNVMSYPKHQRVSSEIFASCQTVLELFRPWMAQMESITLAPLISRFQTPEIAEFAEQKQRIYNLVADLVLASQAVGEPLPDEWASERGVPLVDRVDRVRAVLRDLEMTTSRVNASLHVLSQMMPTSTHATSRHHQSSSVASRATGGTVLSDISNAISPTESDIAAGIHSNAQSKKLQKMLGTMPTASSPSRESVLSTSSRLVPHYLKLDYENEIICNTKVDPPAITGGTLTGLVEQLTRHDSSPTSFRDNFLLTYQSFTTGQELFDHLVARWSIQPPPGLNEDEYNTWVTEKQKLVRLRVYSVFKVWVEMYWMEERAQHEMGLLEQIQDFATDVMQGAGITSVSALLALVDARLKGDEPRSRKITASYQEGAPPKLPKNMKKFKFSDIDPTECARQLTIIQQRLYCRIKQSECLVRTWGSKIKVPEGFEQQEAIKDNVRHANQVTNWIAEIILQHSDLKKRALNLKLIIAVAEACQKMNNYSTLTAILSALGSSPIHRLSRTWNAIDKKQREKVEQLKDLMASSKNFAAYRDVLRSCEPPCIPFLGVSLTDLRFIEDGPPNNLPGTNLINFQKRGLIAETVRIALSFQSHSYNFKSSAELQSFLNDKIGSAPNVHDMYELSIKVEPREREDEKIARLLSESGFL